MNHKPAHSEKAHVHAKRAAVGKKHMTHEQTRDGDDERIRILEIEFIGGPYDGHKEPCSTWPDHLPEDVVWLVCEDVFRLLAGKDRRPCGSFTSVALYELQVGNGAVRYRFVGAISAKELTDSMRET